MIIDEKGRHAYRRFKDVPDELRRKHEAAIKSQLDRYMQERLRHAESRSSSNEHLRPVTESLTKAFNTSPELKDLFQILGKRPSAESHKPILRPFKLPVAELPVVKTGSLMIVQGSPFLANAATSSEPNNPADGLAATADATGSITLGTLNPQNGTIIEAGLLAMTFAAPAEGLAVFQVAPVITWAANWWSTWWRLAEGNVTAFLTVIGPNEIGEVVVTIPQTSSTTLFSQSDQDLFGATNTDGNSQMSTLSVGFCVENGATYSCGLTVSASATANDEADLGHSHMALEVSVQLGSFALLMPFAS